MVGSNEEKVTRFDLPSFKIIVNDGLGFVSRNLERLEIAFRFSSDSDRKEVIGFLEARTKYNPEQYPKINFDSSDENLLVFHGENAKHLAKLLLEDVHFALPIDEFCEFGAAFKNTSRLEERLADLQVQGETLKTLHTNLSENLPSGDMTEVKECSNLEVKYEMEEGLDFTDSNFSKQQLSLVQQIREQNESNSQLSGKIIKQYAAIQQQIADRNKITKTIRDFCNFMISLVKKKETQIPAHAVGEIEAKIAEIPTPKPGSYLSADQLAKCTPEQLKDNVDNLIARFEDHKTAEEKAAKLIKFIATNCKTAYEYTLAKSKPVVIAIIRAVVSASSSVLAAGSSLFVSTRAAQQRNSPPGTPSTPRGNP